MKIKLLLVDDHEIIRMGMKLFFDKQPGFEVVAQASDGENAVIQAKKHKPHVVLMDISMPGIGGLEATSRIQKISPKSKIIVLSAHKEGPFPLRMLKAGASAYLTKETPGEEVLNAVKAVMQGKQYLGVDISQSLALTLLPGAETSPVDSLSDREMEVMLLILDGLKLSEVAEKLSLSVKTVSTYRYRILEKMRVKSDLELMKSAINIGLIRADFVG